MDMYGSFAYCSSSYRGFFLQACGSQELESLVCVLNMAFVRLELCILSVPSQRYFACSIVCHSCWFHWRQRDVGSWLLSRPFFLWRFCSTLYLFGSSMYDGLLTLFPQRLPAFPQAVAAASHDWNPSFWWQGREHSISGGSYPTESGEQPTHNLLHSRATSAKSKIMKRW